MKILPPIATDKDVATINQLHKNLTVEQQDAIMAWGADLVSQSLIKGSLMTLVGGAIPAILFIANRMLREHP